MKRTKKIIRLAICTVAVVLTLSVSVLGCNQKEPDIPTNPTQESSIPTEGTETSATTDAPETTPPGETIPTVDRQAELADARKRTQIPWHGCIFPVRMLTIPWYRLRITDIICIWTKT